MPLDIHHEATPSENGILPRMMDTHSHRERSPRRMKNSLKILIAFFFAFSCLFVTGLSADDEQEVPDEITINNEGYKPDRKGPVPFAHLDHAENCYETGSCQQKNDINLNSAF